MAGASKLHVDRLEDISLVRWVGPLVDGDTASQLRTLIGQVHSEAPFVVLDLVGVDSIDSFGLGLLVWLRTTLERAGGDLKLCAVPANVSRVLDVTRLAGIFDVHVNEAAACAALAAPSLRKSGSPDLRCDILCCDASADLLMYVREVLRAAGFRVAVATNVADAVTLARARRPRVLVISRELRSLLTDANLGNAVPVVELAPDFGRRDPAEAARALLADVASLLAGA
jgi:anti-anti-sigma factor